MIRKEGAERRWSIGELARASGLTIRTLYHYDEIGLLSASERTFSGHRRYTEHDLRRLYRIRALRRLGLPLEEIREVLDDPADDLVTLRELLATQLCELEVHAKQITQLKLQIGGLLKQLDSSAMPDPQQFMTTLEMISMYETYFTQQQQDFLAKRRAKLGEEAIEASKTHWAELVAQLRQHQQAGTPVSNPAVQALVQRWDELATLFHGGNEQIKAAANTMWEDNRKELSQRMGWSADQGSDLVQYLRQARQAGDHTG